MQGDPRPLARPSMALAIALAVLPLSMAALYNGAPLLYADSIDYLLHGGEAARVLFGGESIEWVNTRSFFYALAILPLTALGSAWPIAIAQAAVASASLALAMRTLLGSVEPVRFLAVVCALSLGTSLAWFTGYAMPDLFAALLVLAVGVQSLAWCELGRVGRAGVAALIWFAIVAHASHLLLAAALAIALGPLLMLAGATRAAALRAAVRLAALVAIGAGSTLLLHHALLGEASIGGRRPVFLLARSIADGPARSYLAAHCPELDLAICAFATRLPDNVRDVLWSEHSVWAAASPEVRERLRAEEARVVVAAFRADPWGQIAASAGHAFRQLHTVGMEGSFHPDAYILMRVREALPEAADRWFASRQARRALHEARFEAVQRTVLLGSLLALAASALRLRRRFPRRLAVACALVAIALIANAAITGTIANVEDRYQARLIWLVPFLAGLVLLAWRDARAAAPEARLT